MGNVIQEVSTSNVAREASLQAGVPENVPATTIARLVFLQVNVFLWVPTQSRLGMLIWC